MSLDFNKWRHDLRAMMIQVDHMVEFLSVRSTTSDQLEALMIETLRNHQRKLKEQYDMVLALEASGSQRYAHGVRVP